MRHLLILLIVTISISCEEEKVLLPVVGMTITNLHAPTTSGPGQPPTGKYVKFSFSKEDTVSDEKWDVAFRATDILINGGFKSGNEEPDRTGIGAAHIATGTFSGIKEAPAETLFQQDSQSDTAIPRGGGKGWYNYDPVSHVISPIAGKVLIIKTHDGRYAKMQINSYYKDSPTAPNAFTDQSQHYSFVFTYQPNEGMKSFE